WSRNQGRSWTSAGVASPASDRPDFPAIAISPDGGDAYLTYMDFLQPWQSTTASPRLFEGVVRHADVDRTTGAIGAWSDVHRAPTGDARGSSANALTGEFLGDYDYAFATNDFVVAVWNDARNVADCPAIDAYRQDVVNGTAAGTSTDPTRPAPNNDCPATFGNTDIFGGSYAVPTTTGNPYTDATLDECTISHGRQNEPAVQVDPRNTSLLLGSSNDYCAVYNKGIPAGAVGPIWLGYYRSLDGGSSWTSSLVPGYPDDRSPYAALSQTRTATAGDPVIAWDNHGRAFFGSEA